MDRSRAIIAQTIVYATVGDRPIVDAQDVRDELTLYVLKRLLSHDD